MAKRIRIILILVSMCIIGRVIFKIVRVNAQFKDIKQITVYDKAQEIEVDGYTYNTQKLKLYTPDEFIEWSGIDKDYFDDMVNKPVAIAVVTLECTYTDKSIMSIANSVTLQSEALGQGADYYLTTGLNKELIKKRSGEHESFHLIYTLPATMLNGNDFSYAKDLKYELVLRKCPVIKVKIYE